MYFRTSVCAQPKFWRLLKQIVVYHRLMLRKLIDSVGMLFETFKSQDDWLGVTATDKNIDVSVWRGGPDGGGFQRFEVPKQDN